MDHVDQTGWRSKRWRIAAWSAAAGLMLLPIVVQLVAGHFGWSLNDFLFVATILLIGCLLFDVAARKSPNLSYLLAASAALAAGFGLIVVNGAVGLVGSEDDAHNLMFLAVPGVAVIGTMIAGGRPLGMARTMFASALTHIAVSAGLLIRVGNASDADPVMEVLGLSVFAGIWMASALLFRNAAR